MPSAVGKFLRYVAVPAALASIFIALYFSGNPAMERWVVPDLPELPPNSRREFGLLENLQNALLLSAAWTCLTALRRALSRIDKTIWSALGAGFAALFLEEVDYGLHVYDYFAGAGADFLEVRNLHNFGETTDALKMIVDFLAVAALLTTVPLIGRSRLALGGRWAPDRWLAGTLAVMVACSMAAQALRRAGVNPDGLMNYNLSEFREMLIYYAGWVYLRDAAGRQRTTANLRTWRAPPVSMKAR